jgi:enoyl-CoA hydratase/carnithine racemase
MPTFASARIARPRERADGKLLIDEPAAGIVRLTISNGAKRNALDRPILDAITEMLDALTSPLSNSRCVIVTGAHGMFSSGYDIGEIRDAEHQKDTERLVAHPFTAAIDALEACPCPTVAALPGHAIGGGLELALACDLRIAADHIKLGMPPAKLGLVYSHTGILRFVNVMGATRTRELFLLGQYIDAPTALRWGLANRVVPADDLETIALGTAAELARHAPLAQTGNKRIIAALLEAQGELPTQIEHELIELRRASFASEDMREGIRAFIEHRVPLWRGE